jgi:hypothetical protein
MAVGLIGLRGALLAVGKALAKHEKSTYSCLVRCLHILVMTPGQCVFHSSVMQGQNVGS